MDRDLLARCGQALYGREWVSPLARDLGINLRTVQRWAAGEFKPHREAVDSIREEIRLMLVKRKGEVKQLGREIDMLITEL